MSVACVRRLLVRPCRVCRALLRAAGLVAACCGVGALFGGVLGCGVWWVGTGSWCVRGVLARCWVLRDWSLWLLVCVLLPGGVVARVLVAAGLVSVRVCCVLLWWWGVRAPVVF